MRHFSGVAHQGAIKLWTRLGGTEMERKRKMKAITTKYHGPTDTRGSRITATDSDGNRVTVPFDHSLPHDGVHRKAADALCLKMGWKGSLIQGGTKDGEVFVFDETGDILRDALTLAMATILRLDPTGSKATKGTLDVIRQALGEEAQDAE
jgi:hypothetical protein